MKLAFIRVVALTVVILATAVAQFAQPEGNTPKGQIFDGEALKFDAKLNKILRGISVAELTFVSTAIPATNQLLIKSEAVSRGTLLKLFRYSFLQHYESTIDLNGFKILKTTKHDVQKERVRDSEAIFDYKEKRVTYVETDPKDRTRAPRRIASVIGEQMYDVISVIYAVRLMHLSVGKRFDLQISDSGLVYKVPVLVISREQQKTVLGKVWCYRVEPQIFGKDMLIDKDGKLVIWVTDDARHTPVRAQVNSQYGKIDIKLKSETHAH